MYLCLNIHFLRKYIFFVEKFDPIIIYQLSKLVYSLPSEYGLLTQMQNHGMFITTHLGVIARAQKKLYALANPGMPLSALDHLFTNLGWKCVEILLGKESFCNIQKLNDIIEKELIVSPKMSHFNNFRIFKIKIWSQKLNNW